LKKRTSAENPAEICPLIYRTFRDGLPKMRKRKKQKKKEWGIVDTEKEEKERGAGLSNLGT